MKANLSIVFSSTLVLSACSSEPSKFDGNWAFVDKGCTEVSTLVAKDGVLRLMVTPEGVPIMKFGVIEKNGMVPTELIDRGYTVQYLVSGDKLIATEFLSSEGKYDPKTDPKLKGGFDLVKCNA